MVKAAAAAEAADLAAARLAEVTVLLVAAVDVPHRELVLALARQELIRNAGVCRRVQVCAGVYRCVQVCGVRGWCRRLLDCHALRRVKHHLRIRRGVAAAAERAVARHAGGGQAGRLEDHLAAMARAVEGDLRHVPMRAQGALSWRSCGSRGVPRQRRPCIRSTFPHAVCTPHRRAAGRPLRGGPRAAF